MFETTTSIPAHTIQVQDPSRQQSRGTASRVVSGSRGAALGGNYVAGFGRPQSAPASRHGALSSVSSSGHGYTARFDGDTHHNAAAPVDSYTATFGSTAGTRNPAAGGRGSYTDANL
ncbi:hypothetical protein [Arthrobacter citreus]|uniref:hypothetical protein n=1 Tax=Arthrobacter TaxID=1663 RepID=UPI0036D8E976